MTRRGETWHFWLSVALLFALWAYSSQKLIRSHIDPDVKVQTNKYAFERKLLARRGTIYASTALGVVPLAKSAQFWEYCLDPDALEKSDLCNRKGKEAIIKTIAEALALDRAKVKAMAENKKKSGWRNQFLAQSSDSDSHRTIADSSQVSGVAIHDKQVRNYIQNRRMCHVIGSVNAEHVGSCGVEQRFNKELTGMEGTIRGMKNGRGFEIYDKREISIQPIPGSDVYLTIDPDIQLEAEEALKWGVREYGAGSGWCIVMDSRTGAVKAMASLPDFDPLEYGKTSDNAKINRAVAFNYEPGSVMKTITAAAAIDIGRVNPNTVYNTRRDDPRYYKLPGDGSHVWEPTMTIRDAIVHSSNIVIGKLGYDLGPKTLWTYMKNFGFGNKTEIELPGEQYGILRHWKKWDKATWSRAAIGQGVSVTAIQLISAYQSIANDGMRLKPYIVDRVVSPDGKITYRHAATTNRTVSATTAKTMREIMKGVATPNGTARRAAIRGYSVAGKTGTAQKQLPGARGYAPGLYRATFCGMLPADSPRIVILVTLDFDQCTKFHQGGNSAGPVFKRIANAAIRYLQIPADKPEELEEYDNDDDFDKMLDERAQKFHNE